MSDLQRRSEALLQKRGYLTASVERRKSFPAKGKQRCKACGQMPLISISVDLWNVFDLIAIRPVTDSTYWAPTFVQVTSASNHASRRNKILSSSEAKLCKLSGCSILIQSWKKVQNRFQAHDEWISLDQFAQGLPDTVEQFYSDQARLNLLNRKKRLPPGRALEHEPILDAELPF